MVLFLETRNYLRSRQLIGFDPDGKAHDAFTIVIIVVVCVVFCICSSSALYKFFCDRLPEQRQPTPVIVEVNDSNRPPHPIGQIHTHAHHHVNRNHQTAVTAVPSDQI